jgi:sporulation protein YlmC with PRC-barrel domain
LQYQYAKSREVANKQRSITKVATPSELVSQKIIFDRRYHTPVFSFFIQNLLKNLKKLLHIVSILWYNICEMAVPKKRRIDMAEKPEAIKYDKNNYRIHSAENKQLIKKSLEDCGAGRSILIDNENEIIAGNGVYEQAKKLGIPVKIIETDGKELVVVKRTDLKTDDQKRKILAVMDNTTSDSSEFDIEKLENDFGGIELSDFGIEGIGDVLAGEDGDDIPEAKEGKTSNGTSASELQEIEEDAEDGEMQRIIICYKKSDKAKLEQIFGCEITKILYKIDDLISNGEEQENE